MIANPQQPHSAPGVLAIDIGNSRIAIAAVVGQEVFEPQRFRSTAAPELAEPIARTWARLDASSRRVVVIGSVVPPILQQVRALVQQRLDQTPLVVGQDLPLPMELGIDNPRTVGVDRVCCAAAAYQRLRQACVVVDFGTAITVDCVSDDGIFLGGAILPGMELAATSLHEHTAALPHVEVRQPEALIGRNTEQAIRSGIFYGLIGAVRELVERYAAQLGKWPHLVATGGAAEAVAQACRFIDSVVPDLSLMGIALAYQRHVQGLTQQ